MPTLHIEHVYFYVQQKVEEQTQLWCYTGGAQVQKKAYVTCVLKALRVQYIITMVM